MSMRWLHSWRRLFICMPCWMNRPLTLRFFWVLIEGLKKELGGKPPYTTREKDRIRELIRLYLYEVGTPEWERIFPWDDYEQDPTTPA